jgi:hypothetical protein
MKSTNCTGSHQFHPQRDQLRTSTSLLVEEEFQLQEVLNSAHAKLGAAVNLHYVRSARQGTPTVLSSYQIAYLRKTRINQVTWWNRSTIYGMSKKKDHQKMKEALMALANNDTLGLPCLENLDCPLTFPCPEHIFDSFYKPVTGCLLNYNRLDAMTAVQLLLDRNNTLRLPEAKLNSDKHEKSLPYEC